MKPPKKPAAPPFGLPWNVREGSGTIIEDCNGDGLCVMYAASSIKRKRAARIAAFIVEAANATIKGEKP